MVVIKAIVGVVVLVALLIEGIEWRRDEWSRREKIVVVIILILIEIIIIGG